ncbi:MAG TPA: hypothetical protein PKA88_39755, partial [Polyangiaceae bacterium]|nr:hypothetical protein [Polyangiaceae bacterium]
MTARTRARVAWVLFTALAASLAACRSLPARRDVVTDVDFVGTGSVDEDALEGGLATKKKKHQKKIKHKVFFDYQLFDENLLAPPLE